MKRETQFWLAALLVALGFALNAYRLADRFNWLGIAALSLCALSTALQLYLIGRLHERKVARELRGFYWLYLDRMKALDDGFVWPSWPQRLWKRLTTFRCMYCGAVVRPWEDACEREECRQRNFDDTTW